MSRAPHALALLCAVACATAGAPPPPAPLAGELPGRLALAPAPAHDETLPSWIPVDRATVVVPVMSGAETDPRVSFGRAQLAVPLEGEPLLVRAAGRAVIAYGCDGGTLEVERFEGARRLSPGPVWLLPAPPPRGWKPAAVALQPGPATAEQRSWSAAAGGLTVALLRRDATHAELSIVAAGRRVWSAPYEKYYMEGADEAGIDLERPREIGMPTPAALFRASPGGPALLVLALAGYEGTRLRALLVDGGRAREVDDARFDLGLYFCAF